MALTRVVDPAIIINNVAFPYVPGSVKLDPGFGEQKMATAVFGGGHVETVYSKDMTQNYSTLKVELYNTVEDKTSLLKSIEEWKGNDNNNSISGVYEGESFFIANAALLNKVEIGFGSDTTTSLEFSGDVIS